MVVLGWDVEWGRRVRIEGRVGWMVIGGDGGWRKPKKHICMFKSKYAEIVSTEEALSLMAGGSEFPPPLAFPYPQETAALAVNAGS